MVDSSNLFVIEDFESHINKTHIYKFPIEEVYKAFTDKELPKTKKEKKIIRLIVKIIFMKKTILIILVMIMNKN